MQGAIGSSLCFYGCLRFPVVRLNSCRNSPGHAGIARILSHIHRDHLEHRSLQAIREGFLRASVSQQWLAHAQMGCRHVDQEPTCLAPDFRSNDNEFPTMFDRR